MKVKYKIGIIIIATIILILLVGSYFYLVKGNHAIKSPHLGTTGLSYKHIGDPKLNKPFKIIYSIKNEFNTIALTNLDLNINLPQGVELISGDLNMHIDLLNSKEIKEFEPIELKIIKNGFYDIESHLNYSFLSLNNSIDDFNKEKEYNRKVFFYDHEIYIETKDNFYFIDTKLPENEWVVNSARGLAVSYSPEDPRMDGQDFNFYFTELPEYNKEVVLVFEILPEKDYSYSNVNLYLGQKGIDVIKVLSVSKPTNPNEFIIGDLCADKERRNYFWNGDLKKDEYFKIEFLVKSKYYGYGDIYLTVNNKLLKAHVLVSRFKTEVNYS